MKRESRTVDSRSFLKCTLKTTTRRRGVANSLCWAPDLSLRPEAAGRWPRLATGENSTPLSGLTNLSYAQDAPPSVLP